MELTEASDSTIDVRVCVRPLLRNQSYRPLLGGVNDDPVLKHVVDEDAVGVRAALVVQ
jgi:hypothetical protein